MLRIKQRNNCGLQYFAFYGVIVYFRKEGRMKKRNIPEKLRRSMPHTGSVSSKKL